MSKSLPAALVPTVPAAPGLGKAAELTRRLAADWQRGDRSPAEGYLALLEASEKHAQASLNIVYEEIWQRQELGEEVTLTELQQRFPQWTEELALVLSCHHVLGLAPRAPRFPEVGETLGDFRIVSELGRGGHGRVFLAEQMFLSSRLMILKLSPARDQEHLQLARLQHTHIVPLYAVRDVPERDLRQLCMPCLGGASLAKILENLAPLAPEKRSGLDLLESLRVSSLAGHPRMFWPAQGPNRRFLERASFVQAVCWIGVCLAEALHYAHGQGLVHYDLKPSNVLLTADCQPMLLDFHLARGPVVPGENESDWPGGTPAYMSPEQRAAWQAYLNQTPMPMAVDARTDIYSLGLLLREALYGEDAPTNETAHEAKTALLARSDLPLGIRDILARCLAVEPAARYANAAMLAEDLRLHLQDRPLVGVRNRSLVELWRKWRRRRPYAMILGLLMAICLGAVATVEALVVCQITHRQREAAEALEEGQRQSEQLHYQEAMATFDRGLDRLGEGTDGSPLARRLHHARQRAARSQNIQALHQQVERYRYLHDDDLLAGDTPQSLAALYRTAWEGRSQLLATDDTGLEPELEEMVRCDLLELASFWADCSVRLQPGDAAAQQEAMRVLAEAEALVRPSPVLTRQRKALAGQREFIPFDAMEVPDAAHGERSELRSTPRWAWEHYVLGRWLLRTNDLNGAAAAFNTAVELRPQDFWPWFGKGLCAHRRQHYEEAVTAFSVCIALAPDCAACYYNRGLALAEARREARPGPRDTRTLGDATAESDYGRALELDPSLGSAALNRGVLRLREGRLEEAAADLTLALERGADPASVHYNRALVNQARHDPGAALACLAQALRANPNHKASLDMQKRLRTSFPAEPKRP